jgi:hypothetical protein
MSLIWILIALPLATLLYFAWSIGWQKPIPNAISLAPANPASSDGWWKIPQYRRKIKWVSINELESVTRAFEEVIVVDLLSPDCSRPRLLHEADFLYIKSDEFCDVIRWLPSSSCVLLYGPEDLCRSMINAVRAVSGHAPIFVLSTGKRSKCNGRADSSAAFEKES